MWGDCVLLAPQQFLWFADVNAVVTTLTKRLWLWFMAGTYGSETISPVSTLVWAGCAMSLAQEQVVTNYWGAPHLLGSVFRVGWSFMFSCWLPLMGLLVCTGEGAGAVKAQGLCFCSCTGSFPLHSPKQFYLLQLVGSSYFPLQTRQRDQWLL